MTHTRTRLVATLTMVTLASAVSLHLHAQGRGPGGPGGPGRPPMAGAPRRPGAPPPPGLAMLRRLRLTADQRERVAAIVKDHATERERLRTRLRTAREGVATAVRSATFDEGAVQAAAATLAAAQAEQFALQAKTYAEIFPLLTTAQQEQLRAMPMQGAALGDRPAPPPPGRRRMPRR